jgi:glycosyltransferase involved in cell wall biosynthesis
MPEAIKNISVLMPAFNCGKYIAASIRSILNQTYKEFEFIIINDGSTDNTEEIINSFKDSRIIYKKIENKGTSGALNYGLSIASSEWVARIDADDINVPERLEKQVKFIESNPGYDVISSWSVYFRDPSKIIFLLKGPVENSGIQEYLNLHNPMNQSSTIYRKEKILTARYNEDYRVNEDFELFHRIRNEVRFYNMPEFLVYTRLRTDSKTFSMNSENVYDFLFPVAFKNMLDSKSKGDHFYWASNIAWINFFFGNKKASRSYFKSSVSFKNIIALLSTFLPRKYFNKLIDLRIKYRLMAIFSNTKKYKLQLRKLLGLNGKN